MSSWVLLFLVAFAQPDTLSTSPMVSTSPTANTSPTVSTSPTANTATSNVPTSKVDAATTHLDSSDSSLPPSTTEATGNGTSHVTAGPAISTSLATSKKPLLTSQAAVSTSHNVTATAAGLSDKDPPVTQKPGLVAVVCIFLVVLLLGAIVIMVKCCRGREPAFQKLDEVPMGKVAEGAPFARHPPK